VGLDLLSKSRKLSPQEAGQAAWVTMFGHKSVSETVLFFFLLRTLTNFCFSFVSAERIFLSKFLHRRNSALKSSEEFAPILVESDFEFTQIPPSEPRLPPPMVGNPYQAQEMCQRSPELHSSWL
jgi:hypothetical protein